MASPRARVYLVVPVYNEEPNLPRLLTSVRQGVTQRGALLDTTLVLVDDGSSDRTVAVAHELAQGLELELLCQETNQGPGRAFGRAFAHLAPSLRDDDWVVTLEGDNTSRQELLAQMFTRAAEGYTAVLASPYIFGGSIRNTVTLRVLVSYVANVFLKEVLGLQGIFTMSSFFRLHRGALIRRLQAAYGPAIVERRGFECMVEMLIKMIHVGATLSEVPMVLDTSLRAGRSKMSVLRTTLGYLALLRLRRRWCQAAP